MDPNACLKAMLDAQEDNDMEAAADRAYDLIGWLDMGGFPPTGHTRQSAKAFAETVIKAHRAACAD
jgi:hypothetical protein